MVQVVAFGDLDGGAQSLLDGLDERRAGVAAVGQDAGDLLEMAGTAVEGGQRAVAVRNVSRSDGDRMRQPLRVHGDVALDAGDPLASVVALLISRIRVLHALRVDDQKTG